MNSDFLAQYPEFRGDIPTFNPGPSGLMSNGVTYPEWYNFDTTEEEEFARDNPQLSTLVGF